MAAQFRLIRLAIRLHAATLAVGAFLFIAAPPVLPSAVAVFTGFFSGPGRYLLPATVGPGHGPSWAPVSSSNLGPGSVYHIRPGPPLRASIFLDLGGGSQQDRTVVRQCPWAASRFRHPRPLCPAFRMPPGARSPGSPPGPTPAAQGPPRLTDRSSGGALCPCTGQHSPDPLPAGHFSHRPTSRHTPLMANLLTPGPRAQPQQ